MESLSQMQPSLDPSLNLIDNQSELEVIELGDTPYEIEGIGLVDP